METFKSGDQLSPHDRPATDANPQNAGDRIEARLADVSGLMSRSMTEAWRIAKATDAAPETEVEEVR